MIENPNYDTQKDEIELLKNILFEKMTILEELPHFVIQIDLSPDILEENILDFIITFTLIPEYPDKDPMIEIEETTNNLPSSKIAKLKEDIANFCQENFGMPMIYQIYEMIKDFANAEEESLHNIEKDIQKKKEEEKQRLEQRLEKLDDKLIENRSFTTVTKESFEKFFKDWYSKNCKKDKTQKEQETRITGREFFFMLKNKTSIGENQMEEDEDNIPTEEKYENNKEQKNELFYDENAFEEDLDNLDFDEENEANEDEFDN